MSLLESILYGLVSGISEFLPISSRAHQALLLYLFGMQTRDSFQDLLVHIGLVFAIYFSCHEMLLRLLHEQKALTVSRRNRSRSLDGRTVFDLRLLKTATFPLLIGLLLRFATAKLDNNLVVLMGFLIVNAAMLLLSEHTRHGNRDARTMTTLDGIAIGIVGAFSVFSGISRTGTVSAYARIRGADSHCTVNWAILLSIPALLFFTIFDVLGMIGGGIGAISFYSIVAYFLSGVAAFCGGYFGIALFRVALNHSGLSGFAYYSIGTAFFSFILYLIT